MSADVLRRAASLMRERAEAATPSDGITWTDGEGYSPFSYLKGNDAEHIGSWHPAVAVAVADWLDMMVRARVGTSYGALPFEDAALAVARAYLGEWA